MNARRKSSVFKHWQALVFINAHTQSKKTQGVNLESLAIMTSA
jgi:hypothetical protein